MEDSLLKQVYDTRSFSETGHQIIDLLTKHLKQTTSGASQTVIKYRSPAETLTLWKNKINGDSIPEFIREVLQDAIHIHHPRYMGHQVAAPAPPTLFSSMLSALLNNGMAVYEMGISATAIEELVVQRLCKKLGYGKLSGGFLTSGGTLANLTALLAARRAKVSEDIWNNGLQKPLGVMVTQEAHYCIDRAVRIMGMGAQGIIKIPVRANFAADPEQLEPVYARAKEAGIEVFALVASAPCTATGSYDPVEKMAEFASKHNLWLHVDGAHGGAAIYSSKYSSLLKGVEKADSIVIDGHKMMLMPTITTALLFKDKHCSERTFNQKADYLLTDTDDDQGYNSGNKTFECTKTMMCLNWQLLFSLYGDALFDVYVTRQYDLCQDFFTILKDDPHFEVPVEPMANILCFRWIDSHLSPKQTDRVNAKIRSELLSEGTYYIVQTRLKDQVYLRVSLMNPFTTMEHLEGLKQKIVLIAAKITA